MAAPEIIPQSRSLQMLAAGRRLIRWLTSAKVLMALFMLVLMVYLILVPLYRMVETTMTYQERDIHLDPDAKQVVVELTRRGYRLGILSNTITEREITQWLVEDGLSQYFPTVILSSVFGRRKPGPEIYLEAARQAGVDPAQAAYVGDNPARDVLGARLAGFGMVIIMPEPKDQDEPIAPENKPDLIIHKLSDLLDYFPAR